MTRNIHELYEEIKAGKRSIYGLPVFGGKKPKNMRHVRSYDEFYVLVGDSATTLMLCTRDYWGADSN